MTEFVNVYNQAYRRLGIGFQPHPICIQPYKPGRPRHEAVRAAW